MDGKIVISLDKSTAKAALLCLPLVYLVFFGLLRYGDRKLYIFLSYEDNVLEIISAIVYLFTARVAFKLAKLCFSERKMLDGYVYGLFCLAMAFIFAEEISWGQRIFNISTPEYLMNINTQQEISLHNLAPVQKILHRIYIFIGLAGGILWVFARQNSLLFNNRFVPRWYLMFYFLPVAVFYFSYNYMGLAEKPGGLIGRDQEVFELLLSIGFFLFIYINWAKNRVHEKAERLYSINIDT